ncbi:hypothetical protein HK102_007077 [Quaeritorhiza haematococci]|nr:hypothetical protein HK102_007077 [Quaeritorhiza haematococci]
MRRFLDHVKANLTVAEISGSLGDMGTLLPLLTALSRSGQVSLSASLIFGGFFNILTGLLYDIPMCVQPMKAISAVAIATKMTTAQIVAAGFWVSLTVLILGTTGTIALVYQYIPLAVVRGIQLGTGLRLFTQGIDLVLQSKRWSFATLDLMDNYLIAILGSVLIFALYNARRNPMALLLFIFGCVVGGIMLAQANGVMPKPCFVWPGFVVPSWNDFQYAFISASLGQIPLTLLNSVIAVSKLADDLYPYRERPVASVTSVATCVGLMNIVGMWFGSVPYCHGSGGLAAQYRFGARTGVSVIFLGVIKVFVGLFVGNSLVGLLGSFPNAVLGIMLVLAGVELSTAAKDMGCIHRHLPTASSQKPTTDVEGDDGGGNVIEDQGTAVEQVSESAMEAARRRANNDFVIMVTTAATMYGFRNDGIGFLAGCFAAVLLNLESLPEQAWYASLFSRRRMA